MILADIKTWLPLFSTFSKLHVQIGSVVPGRYESSYSG